MRRISLALVAAVAMSPVARAAPAGFYEAQSAFEGALNVRLRQLVQLDLIAAGYTNAVPTEHFTTRTFKAVQEFQVANGYAPTGQLDAPQLERLVRLSNAPLGQWGFQKVVFPGRSATIWVPYGLGLDEKENGTGLHYVDRQKRLSLDFVAVDNKSMPGVHDGLLIDQQRKGWELHYQAMKDDWFVISTTSPDGHDHYYRYHQDGDAVVGFALEWDNSAGNVNAERIAVIDSAVLGAAMKGEFFVDPPGGGAQAEAAPPQPQPVTHETTPEPPPPSDRVTTGTAFFVSDDGYLVTNAHVVAECSRITVKTDDGEVREAARTATDATNDLAILKLDIAPGKGPKRVAALRIGTRLGAVVATFLDANRVTYKTGSPGGTAMQPADIADVARAMSGFVVCR